MDGESPLLERYPNLFQIAQDTDAKLANCLEFRYGYRSWNRISIQPVNDWELKSMVQLLNELYATKI